MSSRPWVVQEAAAKYATPFGATPSPMREARPVYLMGLILQVDAPSPVMMSPASPTQKSVTETQNFAGVDGPWMISVAACVALRPGMGVGAGRVTLVQVVPPSIDR